MNQTLVRAGRKALDLLYPPHCVLCGRNGAWICAGCHDGLPRAEGRRCDVCWLPVSSESCWRCEEREPAFARLRSAWRYDGKTRQLVRDLKFRGFSCLAEPLGDELNALFAEHELEAEAIVPVPLHARRRRERGFDQSLLLAKRLGITTGLPVIEALERTRFGKPQSGGLTRDERRSNVEGAFRLRRGESVEGRYVLLIDDVATTGATLDACARELLAGGAARVSALTLARED